MANFLTRDNPYLSRVTNDPFSADPTSEVDCVRCLPEQVAGYVADSLAENTRRAYLSDLAHFEAWGGCIPAHDTLVASYLAAHAEMLSVATLVRRMASISKAHAVRGVPNPVRAELVRATLRGIRRRRGSAQHEATPLLKDDLFTVLDAIGDTLKDARDRALLLIGFAGGFRRSELIAIDIGALEFVRQGLIITIPRSKTDQLGAGRKIGIPHGRMRHCPVGAIEGWIERAGLSEGSVFRPVDRHGRVIGARLSGEAVSLVIKERVNAAGIDHPGYSGHSLRAGFVTSAAQVGASSWKIRSQTGHASDAMLAKYIRDGEMFLDNAAGALL
jgi:integrase